MTGGPLGDEEVHDIAMVPAGGDHGALSLCAVADSEDPRHAGEVVGAAESIRHRTQSIDGGGDDLPRRSSVPVVVHDQLGVESVASGQPLVLLEDPVAEALDRFTFLGSILEVGGAALGESDDGPDLFHGL